MSGYKKGTYSGASMHIEGYRKKRPKSKKPLPKRMRPGPLTVRFVDPATLRPAVEELSDGE
jgi:hypothetical protein